LSNLSSFRFLADENIHFELVNYILSSGFDIVHTSSVNLNGKTDSEIVKYSTQENRIILTHDSDFGRIIFTTETDFVGIVYLRPGHIKSEYHFETFNQIIKEQFDFKPPFILVAEKSDETIKLRLRNSLKINR
jgi:predicted nuclease of predicted toxin-antitoxin system